MFEYLKQQRNFDVSDTNFIDIFRQKPSVEWNIFQ